MSEDLEKAKLIQKHTEEVLNLLNEYAKETGKVLTMTEIMSFTVTYMLNINQQKAG